MSVTVAGLRNTSEDVSHNCRIKIYPDGTCEALISDRAVFREPGWEAADLRARRLFREERAGEGSEEASLERARRRARAGVRDLALCNDFSWFVTLTLDPARIDRYDPDAVIRRAGVWLDNRVRRNGLTYVLVPEYHKEADSEGRHAVHFHGFINDAIDAEDSGHRDKKVHKVFNLPAWDFGFTTAIRPYGDYRKAVGYVCKYIAKAGAKIGGRWYYSGGALRRPEIIRTAAEWEAVNQLTGVYGFQVPEARASFISIEAPTLDALARKLNGEEVNT